MTATRTVPASPVVVRVLGASEPARRALAAGLRRGGVRLAARFTSSVSLDAGGWVVSASTAPVQLVCQVQVDDASMRRMLGVLPGAPVRPDLTACGSAVPMRLDAPGAMGAHPTTRPLPSIPFDRPASWFDGPDAAALRPRLHAAARALMDPDSLHPDSPCPDSPRPEAGAALRGLLGLGAGLTPSGDDALVGMLAVLWATRGPSPSLDVLAPLLQQRPPLTTDTSLTYLRLACSGEFSRPVLQLVDALRKGSGVDHAVQQVARLGHSSGADLLDGLAVAMASQVP